MIRPDRFSFAILTDITAAALLLFSVSCESSEPEANETTSRRTTLDEPIISTSEEIVPAGVMQREPTLRPQPPATAPDRVLLPEPQSPATPPIHPSAPVLPSADDDTTAAFFGLTAPKPATWLTQPVPQNSMRLARYIVPGVEGAGEADVVVFHLGSRDRGTVEDNVKRWAGQFQNADGSPVEPQVEELEVSDMPVVIVELSGEYLAMGSADFVPGQRFITAMVLAPRGKVYIRLVGPEKTVEANREPFLRIIHGLKPEPSDTLATEQPAPEGVFEK